MLSLVATKLHSCLFNSIQSQYIYTQEVWHVKATGLETVDWSKHVARKGDQLSPMESLLANVSQAARK